MPRREWKFRVSDIIDAINSIRDYTKGMKLDSFVSDRKTVDAVVWNLIVIGEAATNMPDEIRSKYPDIPWYEMSGMRNFVIHEYFKTSDKIIWDTVQKDLPPLVPMLEKLLIGDGIGDVHEIMRRYIFDI